MKNVVDLLELALKSEKESLLTYLKYARSTKNIGGKNMFIRLAIEEYNHAEFIQMELKCYYENGKTIDKEIEKSEIEFIIPHLKKSIVEGRGVKGVTDLDALRTALDLEQASIDLYKKIYEKAEEEKVKKIAQRLMKMEEAHFELIQAEIDNIKRTGYWFDFSEINLER